MKELILTFKNRNETLIMGSGQDIQIDHIEGLQSSEYVIHTKESALSDGSSVVGKQIKERIIKVIFTVDTYELTEELREKIIRFFNPKFTTNLKIKYWNKQAQIDCEIESLIEFEYNNFNDLLSFELVLKCPKPFLLSVDSFGHDIAESKPAFAFPLAYTTRSTRGHERGKVHSYKTFKDTVELENNGDTEVGLFIELKASGVVVNPKIINHLTNEFMRLNFTMQNGDVITISTLNGAKKVLLKRNNEVTNINNRLDKLSTYFQLKLDKNEIGYEVENGKNNLSVVIHFNKAYLGV